MRNSLMDRMKDVLQRGLEKAMKQGATAARLSCRQWEDAGCSFEAGRLKATASVQGLSYGIDVIAGGRRGTASGNDLADVDEMVGRAITLARVGSAAHFQVYPPVAEAARVPIYAERTLSLTSDRLIEASQAMVDALKAYGPDLFVEAGANRDESEGLTVTSAGLVYPWRATQWSMGVSAQRTQGTDMLFAGYGRGWHDLNEFFDPGVVAGHVIEDLRRGETLVDAPTGKVPVFLPPEAFGTFLWPVMMGVDGRAVAKGDSPLRGRLGEQVLDPCLTIVDNPHRPYANGANERDADGIPTRRMAIFDKGVACGFLYDLDTAGLAGVEPTGHNGCSPYALDVSPGERTSRELLAGIEDGLYIKDLMGFGQSNIMNGDVAGNVALGYRIRNGEIVGRVKNTMVAGNVYELLRRDVQLSSDRDPVSLLPSAVIQGASVSTT